MALPHVFANVSELDTPALDDNFNALGAITVIPCVASGTNAVTLTPAANTPTISAYSNNAPEFSFEAASTSSSSLTLQVLGLGLKNVYKNNGATAAGANDFIAGSTYKVTYNSALNAAAGGWVILNQGASSAGSAGSVQGAFKNLKVQTTSDTAIAVTANQIAVSDGSTAFTTIFAPSLTINSGTTGANGIDTGAVSTSTWYYVYAIYNVNTSTAAGLMSLSATAPSLPAGYAQFARVGAVQTDGSSHFYRTLQYGRTAQYIVGTNPANTLIAGSGTIGTYSGTSPTLTAVTVQGNGYFVPPTASKIGLLLSTAWKNGTVAQMIVAPSSGWGGTNNGPIGTGGNIYPWYGVSGGSIQQSQTVWMVLESTAIYAVSNNTGCAIGVLGWEDNL